MRHSVSGSALIAALTIIQGCSVSDTLTPPLDVGTSGSISDTSPLTRTDMQTAMAQNQSVYTAPVREQAVQPSYSYPAQPSPQNSLEAQAQSLQNGYNPVASKPLDAAPGQYERQRQPVYQRQPVENQHNTYEQPMPARQQARQQEPAQAPAQTEASSPAPLSNQQASIAPDSSTANTIRFLPIIGAPAQEIMPLSRQLGNEARQKGLVLRDSSDEPAQHILKGYFSAYSDGNKTVVVYVWDILDANGNRLHRIQGQETVHGETKDPWASVPASTMQTIATKTMDDYQKWRLKSTG